MKKLFAIALAAALALSLAACSGGGETSSQTESSPASSAAESSAESKTEDSKTEDSKTEESKEETSDSLSEAESEIKEAFEKLKSVSGDKTKKLLDDLTGDTITANLVMNTETKSSEESSSALGNQTIGLRIIRNGDKASRLTAAVGMMSLDILTNEEGTFYINSSTKKAAKLNLESSGDSTSILNSMTSMVGGTGSLDLESVLDNAKDTNVEDIVRYIDTTETEYSGSTYTAENYTVKGNDEDGTEMTSTMNLLFDGDDLKYILLDSEKGKMDVSFTELTTEIDESLLVVPENYEITETSTSD